ncbi:portal protein [Stappia indica]|uniref:portal protein n=1 Tax=Stappia indica TaxID=538381 RepID=UPI001CD4CA26|nr:hypothetical protein [Stappia indica]MCA1298031.1 hypothetical protein [Stappia indica]
MDDSVVESVEPEADDIAPTTATEADELMDKFRRWYRDDSAHASAWVENAREDYQFVAGDQYSAEEKASLRAQNRPDVVFNRLAPMVRSIAGYQVNQRLATIAKPTEPGDEQSAEIANASIRWFRDQSDAQFSDGDAFEDATICGMGWTEIRLDYEEDLDGHPLTKRLNPLQMRWDHRARERNLKDARRIWQIIEDMPLSEAREMFPEADITDLNAKWALDVGGDGAPEDQGEADRYEGDGEEEQIGTERLVTIVRVQWWERETVYRVISPQTGRLETVDAATFDVLKARLPGIRGVRQRRKVYRQAYLGKTVLEQGPTPCKWNFSLQCVTGFRDQIKGHFYGLVTGLKDPQRWANKWMSQTMHILNGSAKGGVIIEDDIAENMREFERSWARHDAVTKVRKGVLQQGRIQDKPSTPFPSGFYQLMDMAINAMRDVSGVNLEMLGQRDANQPGVVETQRRSAALTTLVTLFECMRMYRRTQGEVIISIVKDYLPEHVLQRVVGQQLGQIVPAFMQSETRFDIIVDEAPESPNAKDLIWSMMGQSIHQQPPQVQAVLWKYSPLPGSAAAEMTQAIQSAMQPAPPDPNQQAAMQAQQQQEQAKISADIQKVQFDVEAKRIDLEAKALDLQAKQIDLEIARENARVAGVKAQADQVKAEAGALKAVADSGVQAGAFSEPPQT